MGKISSGQFGSLPYVPKRNASSWYIDLRFAFGVHRRHPDGLCVQLGCDESWSWKDGSSPPLAEVSENLGGWSAYRHGYPSKVAEGRQTREYKPLKKKEAVEKAFPELVRLAKSWSSVTVLCPWDERQLVKTYNEATTFLGSTMVTSKALYFLVPDLFVILDGKQVYPSLREEIRLPDHIDQLDGKGYVALLAYVRGELQTLIGNKTTVKLKDGSTLQLKNVNDFRWLSPRQVLDGTLRPGAICKVVDDIFAPENDRLPVGWRRGHLQTDLLASMEAFRERQGP